MCKTYTTFALERLRQTLDLLNFRYNIPKDDIIVINAGEVPNSAKMQYVYFCYYHTEQLYMKPDFCQYDPAQKDAPKGTVYGF